MKRYYYHGIELQSGYAIETLEIVIKILNEGLLSRDKTHRLPEEGFNHVCLFKKNEEINYDDIGIHDSALYGWIYNCIVFILNPNLKTYKPVVEERGNRIDSGPEPSTDLIDEYRSYGSISKEDIIGLALPESFLKNEYDFYNEEEKQKFRKCYDEIMRIIEERNMFIYNSEIEDFTDILDEQLNLSEEKERNRNV